MLKIVKSALHILHFGSRAKKPRGQDKMTERNGFPESSRLNGRTET